MTARQRGALIRRLERLAKIAIPGTLVEVFLPCGNPDCACHEDAKRRHGPHLYLKYRSLEGRSTGIYIPRWAEREARRSAQAWREMKGMLAAIGDANRETLRTRIQTDRRGRA